MNKKHLRTLAAIFSPQIPRTLPFRDIESLLRGVGCKVKEGPGSAVDYVFGDKDVAFHRPHPTREAKAYQIKAAREFLKSIGVEP